MNELWGILLNAPWILGLAVMLATWSQAACTAAMEKRPVWRKFDEPGYTLATDVGMLLVAAGLALAEKRTWAQVVWGLIAIVLIVEIVLRSRKRKMNSKSANSES